MEVETAEEAAHLKQLCQNKGRVGGNGMRQLERFRLCIVSLKELNKSTVLSSTVCYFKENMTMVLCHVLYCSFAFKTWICL